MSKNASHAFAASWTDAAGTASAGAAACENADGASRWGAQKMWSWDGSNTIWVGDGRGYGRGYGRGWGWGIGDMGMWSQWLGSSQRLDVFFKINCASRVICFKTLTCMLHVGLTSTIHPHQILCFQIAYWLVPRMHIYIACRSQLSMAQWTRNVHFKQLNMHFQTYKIATFAFSNGTETAHLACKSPFSMAQWTIFSNSIFMFRPTRLPNIHFEWYQKRKLQRLWWRCNMHFHLLKMLLKVHFIPNYPPPASVMKLRRFIYQ